MPTPLEQAVLDRDVALQLVVDLTKENARLTKEAKDWKFEANDKLEQIASLTVARQEKIDEGQEIAARSSDLVNDAKAAQSEAQVEANKAKADIGAVRDALVVKTKTTDDLTLAVTAHETAATASAAKVAALEVRVNEQNAELGRRPVPV